MATKKSVTGKRGTKKGGAPKSSKKSGKKSGGKKSSSKRELIDTGRDKRFVRRDDRGRFNESDDVGRSLAQDVKRPAKKKVPVGQGDKGDRKRK